MDMCVYIYIYIYTQHTTYNLQFVLQAAQGLLDERHGRAELLLLVERPIHVYVHIYIYTHVYIHVYIYIYTHTYT